MQTEECKTTEDVTGRQDPRLLNPVSLAFLGDAVYELLVRRRLVNHGSMPANKLHVNAVRMVCAGAQAQFYDVLEPVLTEEELQILKRGRNAHTSKVPKNANPADYRRATGLEALFGYLFLKEEQDRLEELFGLLVEHMQAHALKEPGPPEAEKQDSPL